MRRWQPARRWPRASHQEVDGEHLLAELLAQEHGLAQRILEQAGVSTDRLRAAVQKSLAGRPKVTGGSSEAGKIYITQRLQQLFASAGDEAAKMQDEYISVEHLLLAFIMEGEDTEAGRILKKAGVSRDAFLAALESVRGHQRVTTDSRSPSTTH